MGRPRKNKKEDSDNKKEEKRMGKVLLSIPTLKLESVVGDPFLAKVISITYISLIDLKKIKYKYLTIEENRYNSTFLYYIENKKLHLSGWIGRDKNTHSVRFLAVDQKRFHWAELEGFIKDKNDPVERQFVFEKIGALRDLNGLNSFINYIAGDNNYLFEGDYILSPGELINKN